MTGYDILMIVILVASLVHGAWRGMIWQIAPIVSLVLAYIVALPVSAQIAHWFGNEAPTNQYIAMLVVYLAVSLLVYVVASLFKGLLAKIRLEEYDRHIGSLLGGVKGLLVCMALTFFLVTLSESARDTVLRSQSGYLAAVVMDAVHPVMPPKFHELLEPYIHGLDDAAAERGIALKHRHDAVTPPSSGAPTDSKSAPAEIIEQHVLPAVRLATQYSDSARR